MKKYLKIKEASEYLGIHIDTLRNWEKQGLITPKRFGSRKDRIYFIDELDQLFETQINK